MQIPNELKTNSSCWCLVAGHLGELTITKTPSEREGGTNAKPVHPSWALLHTVQVKRRSPVKNTC